MTDEWVNRMHVAVAAFIEHKGLKTWVIRSSIGGVVLRRKLVI